MCVEPYFEELNVKGSRDKTIVRRGVRLGGGGLRCGRIVHVNM